MAFKLGEASVARLARVHPDLAHVVFRAIRLTTQDFGVTTGARTAAEQHALFLKGASQKDGYKNRSNHQVDVDGLGDAVDLTPWVTGKGYDFQSWDLAYPVAVAMSQAARELQTRIRWGGNWYEAMDQYPATIEGVKAAVERYKLKHPGPDFLDGPHFELAK